jgi:imidazoleglycerol phosphate dehydratase HisB
MNTLMRRMRALELLAVAVPARKADLDMAMRVLHVAEDIAMTLEWRLSGAASDEATAKAIGKCVASLRAAATELAVQVGE